MAIEERINKHCKSPYFIELSQDMHTHTQKSKNPRSPDTQIPRQEWI